MINARPHPSPLSLERFTLLEFEKKNDKLLLHYRFKIDKKTIDMKVKLKPEPTADEIVQSATDAK